MTALKQAHTTRVVVPPQRFPEEPAVFRFPTPDDPPPGAARVLAIALYGTVLGVCGVGVGFYAVIAVFGGAPAWYLPALAALTMLSVAPVVGAFLSIHRRILPWFLLLAAAPPMAADVMVALAY